MSLTISRRVSNSFEITSLIIRQTQNTAEQSRHSNEKKNGTTEHEPNQRLIVYSNQLFDRLKFKVLTIVALPLAFITLKRSHLKKALKKSKFSSTKRPRLTCIRTKVS